GHLVGSFLLKRRGGKARQPNGSHRRKFEEGGRLLPWCSGGPLPARTFRCPKGPPPAHRVKNSGGKGGRPTDGAVVPSRWGRPARRSPLSGRAFSSLAVRTLNRETSS